MGNLNSSSTISIPPSSCDYMRILPSSFSATTTSRLFKLPLPLFSPSPSSSMTVSSTFCCQPHHHLRQQTSQQSIVVIMGATGTGKTKLSIDVATRFGAEIINSDKIQVYRGLDITTNKVPLSERRGVPHHLLGTIDPSAGELSSASFRSLAAAAVQDIASRGRLPVVAGGSNSYVHALVSDRFDPKYDPFGHGGAPRSHRLRLRYRCCFIWVDVEAAALREYLDRRVEEMVGSGMVEELEGYFGKRGAEGGAEWERNVGLNRAIGVPEFWGHFGNGAAYEEAVAAIKENTRRLAVEQVRKIRRLGEGGWALQRVDATGVVRARLERGGPRADEDGLWDRDVAGPAFGAVEKFLDEGEDRPVIMLPAAAAASCCC